MKKPPNALLYLNIRSCFQDLCHERPAKSINPIGFVLLLLLLFFPRRTNCRYPNIKLVHNYLKQLRNINNNKKIYKYIPTITMTKIILHLCRVQTLRLTTPIAVYRTVVLHTGCRPRSQVHRHTRTN